MNKLEFNNQFDVLYNNLTSNLAPGLNSYEKSVILTKGQEEVIKNYFNPKSNPKGEGFDDNPKRQADFSSLIRTATMIPASNLEGLDRRSHGKYIYTYPSDVFIVLNELIFDTLTQYVVVPISYQEYDLKMSKPYKFPPKYLAWRLISGLTTKGETVTYTEEITEYITNITPGEVEVTIDGGARFTFENTSTDIDFIIETICCNDTLGNSITFDDSNNHVFFYIDPNTSMELFSNELNFDLENSNPPINSITIDSSKDDIDNDYVNKHFNDYPELEDKCDRVIDENTEEEIPIIIPKATTVEVPRTRTVTKTATINKDIPIVELIGKFGSNFTYSVRYIKRPMPIILEDFSLDNLSINGKNGSEEFYANGKCCELPEQLHEEILQRAVELAKVAWASSLEEVASLQAIQASGVRSE